MRYHIENLEAVRVSLYPDSKYREIGGGVQAAVGSVGFIWEVQNLRSSCTAQM